jgi:Peptidase family M49
MAAQVNTHMYKKHLIYAIGLLIILNLICTQIGKPANEDSASTEIAKRMEKYVLTPMPFDASQYSSKDKELLQTLIEAGRLIDEIYWRQTYSGNIALQDQIVKSRSEDDPVRKFFFMQAGPFDRLDKNAPFMDVPPKPETAGFYPPDMTKEEFENWIKTHPNDKEAFLSPYTVIKRQGANLIAVPYHTEYKEFLDPIAQKLRHAATLTTNADFKKYLLSKAEALLTDKYFATDVDWIDMKDNKFDMLIGPFEVYEDEMNGLKASYEAIVEIVDSEESAKLEIYKKHLAELEANLPYPEKYKTKGANLTASFTIVRDIYRGGDARVGYQAVATNLPNDPEVQAKKGSKKTFWKNILEARLNKIIVPVGNQLIAQDQVKGLTGQGLFDFVLLHEIAHGLGPRYVHGTQTPINEKLRDLYSWIEENKADMAGLHSLGYLRQLNIINQDMKNQHYVSFLGGIFRTIRFGTTEAHGKAAIVSLNFFLERGAIQFNPSNKRYSVDFTKFDSAISQLASELLLIEAEGDYSRAKTLEQKYSKTPEYVQASLDTLKDQPVDLVPVYNIRWQ